MATLVMSCVPSCAPVSSPPAWPRPFGRRLGHAGRPSCWPPWPRRVAMLLARRTAVWVGDVLHRAGGDLLELLGQRAPPLQRIDDAGGRPADSALAPWLSWAPPWSCARRLERRRHTACRARGHVAGLLHAGEHRVGGLELERVGDIAHVEVHALERGQRHLLHFERLDRGAQRLGVLVQPECTALSSPMRFSSSSRLASAPPSSTDWASGAASAMRPWPGSAGSRTRARTCRSQSSGIAHGRAPSGCRVRTAYLSGLARDRRRVSVCALPSAHGGGGASACLRFGTGSLQVQPLSTPLASSNAASAARVLPGCQRLLQSSQHQVVAAGLELRPACPAGRSSPGRPRASCITSPSIFISCTSALPAAGDRHADEAAWSRWP